MLTEIHQLSLSQKQSKFYFIILEKRIQKLNTRKARKSAVLKLDLWPADPEITLVLATIPSNATPPLLDFTKMSKTPKVTFSWRKIHLKGALSQEVKPKRVHRWWKHRQKMARSLKEAKNLNSLFKKHSSSQAPSQRKSTESIPSTIMVLNRHRSLTLRVVSKRNRCKNRIMKAGKRLVLAKELLTQTTILIWRDRQTASTWDEFEVTFPSCLFNDYPFEESKLTNRGPRDTHHRGTISYSCCLKSLIVY